MFYEIEVKVIIFGNYVNWKQDKLGISIKGSKLAPSQERTLLFTIFYNITTDYFLINKLL